MHEIICPYCENELDIECKKVECSPVMRMKQVIKAIEQNIGATIPVDTLKADLGMDDASIDSYLELLKLQGFIEIPRKGFVKRVL